MQNKVVEQLKQAWQRMNPRQRIIVVGGTLAAVAGLAVLTVMMTSTDYKPLMTGLEPEDVKAISQQLAAKKIDFKMTPDGKEIDVAADHLDEARIEVASQGTTHSGRMGFELFDKSSWGQTEFDEKVNYQRALEGELERTISTLNNVKSALGVSGSISAGKGFGSSPFEARWANPGSDRRDRSLGKWRCREACTGRRRNH
jgi:flagellar M-ring protein FliF